LQEDSPADLKFIALNSFARDSATPTPPFSSNLLTERWRYYLSRLGIKKFGKNLFKKAVKKVEPKANLKVSNPLDALAMCP
jgi:hypothetical protein